jgi:hypothetical protein
MMAIALWKEIPHFSGYGVYQDLAVLSVNLF